MSTPNSKVVLSFTSFGAAATAIVIALWFGHQRLHHSDLWGHLAYGRLMWEQQALPTTEPFMPASAETPMMATAWLSQIAGYLVWRTAGHHGLQLLHGLLVGVCVFALMDVVRKQTRLLIPALLAGGVFLFVGWQQLRILRPQLAGLVCFTLLLHQVLCRTGFIRRIIAVVLIFALWANVHPSFFAGWAFLAAFAAGRFADVWRRTGSLHRGLTQRRSRQATSLLAAAVVASCGNPYHARLWGEIVRVAGHPNLRDLLDWQPLNLGMRQTPAALVTAGLMVCLSWYVRNRRRTPCWEWLALLGYAGLAINSSRMLIWWAVVAAVCLGVRVGAAVPAAKRSENRASGDFSMPLLALAIVAFVATPLARSLVRGTGPVAGSVNSYTPVGATRYLEDHNICGPTFAPNTWGDYFIWDMNKPPALLATSHVHLVPAPVWRDYRTISLSRPGAGITLRKYAINTVVLGRRHGRLIGRLRDDSAWTVVFRDSRSIIFRRDSRKAKARPDGRQTGR